VAQQRLRRHDDQRLALLADGLATQHVEDLGGVVGTQTSMFISAQACM
jgi:hypothetical protein